MASFRRLARKAHRHRKELRELKRCYCGKVGRRAVAFYVRPPVIYIDGNYNVHVIG